MDFFTELLCRKVVQSQRLGRMGGWTSWSTLQEVRVGGLINFDDERWQADIDKLLGYLRLMRAASQEYPQVQE
jgi:hypothetical protein